MASRTLLTFLAVAMIAADVPGPAKADTPTFGQVEVAAGSWMEGYGVSVRSNTQDFRHDSGIYDKYGLEYQCVELAQRTWGANGWDGSLARWGVNGDEIFAAAQSGALAKYATVTAQGSIAPSDIHPGALVTWRGGANGHVAVVDTVGPNANGGYTVRVVGENQGKAATENPLTLSANAYNVKQGGLGANWTLETTNAAAIALSG